MDYPPRDKADTIAILNRIGLPSWFSWNGKQVLPTYRIEAFGKWLKETPYHRGLFAECHEALVSNYAEIETADDLADVVERRLQARRDEFLPGMAPNTDLHAD